MEVRAKRRDDECKSLSTDTSPAAHITHSPLHRPVEGDVLHFDAASDRWAVALVMRDGAELVLRVREAHLNRVPRRWVAWPPSASSMSARATHARHDANTAASLGPLLARVPDAVLPCIMRYLDVRTLRHASAVSGSLHTLANDEAAWAVACERAWRSKRHMPSVDVRGAYEARLPVCPFAHLSARISLPALELLSTLAQGGTTDAFVRARRRLLHLLHTSEALSDEVDAGAKALRAALHDTPVEVIAYAATVDAARRSALGSTPLAPRPVGVWKQAFVWGMVEARRTRLTRRELSSFNWGAAVAKCAVSCSTCLRLLRRLLML